MFFCHSSGENNQEAFFNTLVRKSSKFTLLFKFTDGETETSLEGWPAKGHTATEQEHKANFLLPRPVFHPIYPLKWNSRSLVFDKQFHENTSCARFSLVPKDTPWWGWGLTEPFNSFIPWEWGLEIARKLEALGRLSEISSRALLSSCPILYF